MGQIIELTAKRSPLREGAALRGDDRARVVEAVMPFLRDPDPSRLDEVIEASERELDTALWAREQGFHKNPQHLAPSVRKKLEELGELARKVGEFRASLSKDEEKFLEGADLLAPGSGDGFDFLAIVEPILSHWSRRAVSLCDQEAAAKITPGRAYRWDLRLAGEGLADVWEKHTGRNLSRQNWSPCAMPLDEGPFPDFLRAVLQTIEPEFRGVWLARQIKESRPVVE